MEQEVALGITQASPFGVRPLSGGWVGVKQGPGAVYLNRSLQRKAATKNVRNVGEEGR